MNNFTCTFIYNKNKCCQFDLPVLLYRVPDLLAPLDVLTVHAVNIHWEVGVCINQSNF